MKERKSTAIRLMVMVLILSMITVGCSQPVKENTAETMPTDTTKGVQETSENNNVEKVQLKWGAASLGSSAQMVCSAIGSVVNKHSQKLELSVQATAGSAENVRLIRNKEIDIANAGEPYNAKFSKGTFEGEPSTDLWALFSLYESAWVFVVKDDSNIKTIDDLVGKRICMGPAGSGTYQCGYTMLEALDLLDKVSIVAISYNDANDAMMDGTLDAMIGFLSAGIPAPALEQLNQSTELYIIPTDASIYQSAFDKYPDYGPSKIIKAGTYKPIKEDMSTFCNYSIEYADSRMSDEVAYELVKTLYENNGELGSYHQIAGTMTADKALNGIPKEIPVHPGAAKYYKEIGVWNDNLKVAER